MFGSDLKVLTRENRGRRADLAVYLPGSPAPPRRDAIRRPPDILVEVVTHRREMSAAIASRRLTSTRRSGSATIGWSIRLWLVSLATRALPQ